MKNSRIAAILCVASCVAGGTNGYAAGKFPTKLFLSSDGLALSSFPSSQNLTQTISVSRTQGQTQANWTAASSEPWLTVTPSGVTGSTLTVTAKPGKLKHDKSYTAKVTISTSGADFSDKETLLVGFWAGSADPLTVTVQQNGVAIATNPVSPIAYVANGNAVYEYNVYSGVLVGTLLNVVSLVGALAVSSDGQTLFVTDTSKEQIVALDAAKGKQLHTYPVSDQLGYGYNVVYARPFGQPALYAAGGSIIAYPKGTILATGLPYAALAATPDGRSLFAVVLGQSPGILYNYSVGLNGKSFTITPITSAAANGSNCQALAVSHDGNHLYPACGAPYEFNAYDGKTLEQVQSLPAEPYPNNIGIDENDNVVGGIDGLYQQDDIFAFDQNGNALGQVPTTQQSYAAGQQSAAMGISGDATRVISITASVYNPSQTLMFRSLP